MGAPSTVVTLSDLGVNWHQEGNTGFSPIPGLSSLYAIRPGFFIKRGDTKVAYLIQSMVDDPSL